VKVLVDELFFVSDWNWTLRIVLRARLIASGLQPSEKKKGKKSGAGTYPGGQGGYLNSPVVIGVGGAVILGGAIWFLSKSDDPVSPAKP